MQEKNMKKAFQNYVNRDITNNDASNNIQSFLCKVYFYYESFGSLACSLNKDEIFKIFKDGFDLSVKAKT